MRLMKTKNDKYDPDLHELLVEPIDVEMEAYLCRQGLAWLFKRRRQYEDFLKKQGATEHG